jgi:hypothetical protein
MEEYKISITAVEKNMLQRVILELTVEAIAFDHWHILEGPHVCKK